MADSRKRISHEYELEDNSIYCGMFFFGKYPLLGSLKRILRFRSYHRSTDKAKKKICVVQVTRPTLNF